MRFVGRREELAFLGDVYRREGFQFVPIYGRRRIGKTTLVLEFIKNKPAVYFLAETITEGAQLRSLGREVGERFGDMVLAETGFRDWDQFFRYMAQRASHERLILAIDEFPYLVHSNRGIASIFQKGIDLHLRQTQLVLILLGSSIGMMEEEVLLRKAPLYGRRTGSVELGEMPFAALAEFLPAQSFDMRASTYSVVGGIPAYLEKWNPSVGLMDNLRGLVCAPRALLYDEVEFLLREELREPRNYFLVLRAIAQGNRKLAEIANETGFDKPHLGRYLDILRSLRITEKEVPVTEKYPDKSRLGLYRIHDRFLAFWFKYVFPYRGRLAMGDTEYLMQRIKETFDQHVSSAYEEICKEACSDLLKQGRIHFTHIGRWWSRNEEIDLVAIGESDRSIHLAECKWSRKKVGTDIYQELVRKSRLVDWNAQSRAEHFILFSRSGFTDEMRRVAEKDDVLLVTGVTPEA